MSTTIAAYRNVAAGLEEWRTDDIVHRWPETSGYVPDRHHTVTCLKQHARH